MGTCVSVDPGLRPEFGGSCPRSIQRLQGFGAKFEDFCVTDLRSTSIARAPVPRRLLVLLCVHSHHRFTGEASIDAVRGSFGYPPTCLVSIPCCPQFSPMKDVGRAPDVRYDDWAIFSHCRTVLIWKWAAGPDTSNISQVAASETCGN